MTTTNSINNNKYDLIIVGGGIIGCATAFHLLRSGFSGSILLLEKTSSVASCASGHAGGFLARNWCANESGLDPLSKFSFDLHCQYASQVGADKIGFRKVTAVSATIGKSSKSSTSSNSSSWIKGSCVEDIENLVEDDHATAQVHPRLLTESLIQQAQETAKSRNQILHVVTSCGVSELMFAEEDKEKNEDDDTTSNNNTKSTIIRRRCCGVVDMKGNKIEAAIVHLCVGPWSAHIKNWIPSSYEVACSPYLVEISDTFRLLKVQSILIHLQKTTSPYSFLSSSSSSSSKPVPTPPQAIFTYPSDDSEFSGIEPEIYPRPDGTLYLCGISDKEPLPLNPSHVKGNPEKGKILRKFADVVLLKEEEKNSKARANQQQQNRNDDTSDHTCAACYLPMPPDNRKPLIGPIPETDDTLYFASGHNCWGILNSHGTGVAISEMLMKKYPQYFGVAEKNNNNEDNSMISDKIQALLPSTLLKWVTTQLEERKGSLSSASSRKKNETKVIGAKRGNENW